MSSTAISNKVTSTNYTALFVRRTGFEHLNPIYLFMLNNQGIHLVSQFNMMCFTIVLKKFCFERTNCNIAINCLTHYTLNKYNMVCHSSMANAGQYDLVAIPG